MYQQNTSVWPHMRLYKTLPSKKQHKILNQHYIQQAPMWNLLTIGKFLGFFIAYK